MDNKNNKHIDFIEYNLKNGKKTFSYKELVNLKVKMKWEIDTFTYLTH